MESPERGNEKLNENPEELSHGVEREREER